MVWGIVETSDGKRLTVPLAVAVMSSKRTEEYKLVFETVFQALPSLEPEQFISDFELGIVKGFRAAKPGIPQSRYDDVWNECVKVE